jgi:arylsulfatase A-like enzyme
VFEANRSDKPPYVREQDTTLSKAKEIRRKQLRTEMAVDGLVAKLDRRLRRLNERKNTLVIFVSDNGYAWGEHGLIGSHFSKNSPYTESIRVPMLMRWPKGLESGKSKRLTTNVDIAPTIYDATGVEPATEPDGRSLLDKSWQRNTIFLEHFLSPKDGPQVPAWGSVRGHDYQYVETYDENGVLSFTEYYDLEEDHFQRRNLLMDDDPTNDPNFVDEHLLVDRFSTCRGTDGDNPCP